MTTVHDDAPRPRASKGLGRGRGKVERIIFLTLGWVLLALGLLGGLLPFIQGWPFGVLGAAILYLESRAVQRRVYRWRKKHPRLEATFSRARAFLKERRRRRQAKRDAKAAAPR